MTAVPVLLQPTQSLAQDTGLKQDGEPNGVANYVASFHEPKPLQ
jgi:hypothetical protein